MRLCESSSCLPLDFFRRIKQIIEAKTRKEIATLGPVSRSKSKALEEITG